MKYLTLMSFCFLLFACSNNSTPTEVDEETGEQYFGKKIENKDFISYDSLLVLMKDKKEANVKVEGVVDGVCQKKGCWMTVKNEGGEESSRVRFEDYSFFMPLDCAGKSVAFEGKAFWDTTTVEMLRHYAEDAEKSEEEIMQITEPEVELAFEAIGVILKENQ